MPHEAKSESPDKFQFLSEYPWFAVRVKSKFERTSAMLLQQKGYSQYFPTFQVESRWSDRTKRIEKPLFPGYVFCSFNPNQRLPILATPGVVQIVGIGKDPEPVDERELEALWYTLRSGVLTRPHPYLKVGERVIVERGPLAGIEGIVTEFKGQFRLVVAISLLQRAVAAEIEANWVRPVRRSPIPTVAGATAWAEPGRWL